MRLSLVFAALALATTPALAADDPTGDWMVADGNAMIRIENCGGALWGFVFWEKQPGGLDAQNPDPSRRDRPTLGLPILRNMQASSSTPNRWDGEVYNAQNGKTYTSHISLSDPNTLRIEGCVLGFLCGGQNWTRGKLDPTMTPTAASVLASQTKAGAGKPGAKAAPKPAAKPAAGAARKPGTAAASESEDNLCSTLAELPGPAH